MRRRPVVRFCLLAAGIPVALALGLCAAAAHVPAFYRDAEPPPAAARQLADEFARLSLDLFAHVTEPDWHQQFGQDQMNGHLADRPGLSDAEAARDTRAALFDLPDWVREPRVAFDADRLRVGFRYGRGWFSGVASVDVRVWLVAKEPNVIALELCDFSFGAVPLGSQWLIEQLTEQATKLNIKVTPYRHRGRAVLLLQFQHDQPRPTFLLRRFEFQAGKFVIAGSRTGDAPAPPPAPKAG